MSDKILDSAVELFKHAEMKRDRNKEALESSKYYNVAMIIGYDNVEYSESFLFIDRCLIIKDVTKVSDYDMLLINKIMNDVSTSIMKAGNKKIYIL